MDLSAGTAEIYVPDGSPEAVAIASATHMAIAAHHDDIETMAYHGILECFGRDDRAFVGVVVTDGAGSPRTGPYSCCSDEDMRAIRRTEQKKAAIIGQYRAQALLDHPSAVVKDPEKRDPIEDIKKLISVARPKIIYTHNLADKHDTHVAVALRTIQALRELPRDVRPSRLYGCESWRDLDWLVDSDKVVLDVQGRDNLAQALIGVFDSQITGGKRYDVATMGRRIAHATYHSSHATDSSTALIYAMDLTPLIEDDALGIEEYVNGYVRRLGEDVSLRIRGLE